MILYRYFYDTFTAGETKSFTIFSAAPTMQSKLCFIHLYNKDSRLIISYRGHRIVDLDTSEADDFPPGFPLNLIVQQYHCLVVSLKNTDAASQDIYLTLVWDTQVTPYPESIIKISSYGYTASTDTHLVLKGIPNRKLWLDCVYQMKAPPDDIIFHLDGVEIQKSMNIPQASANHNYYWLQEHPLFSHSEFTYTPWRVDPSINTRLVLLYHDLPFDAEVTQESAPFPYFPLIPPYPFIPYTPTPIPYTPPYPPIEPEPPFPPHPDVIPYDPSVLEEWEIIEMEELSPFKTAIPLTFAQKNKITNQPIMTSSLRPSFFPSASMARREKVAPDYIKTFSHILGEGIFNTIPFRVTETGQLISTNVKDHYQVIDYEHTDANYHDYAFELPFTHLYLKTGSAAWKVKFLTVYKWLSLFDVQNMDEIDLAASSESFFPYYAVILSLCCPTASGGSPQSITGLIEF